MSRSTKRKGFDSAVYYGNKKLASCTVADGQAFAEYLRICGNSAARVLREFAYFSVELKDALTKMAAIQEKEASKA